MSIRIAAVTLLLLGTACAAAKKHQVPQDQLTQSPTSPRLFVGHSQSGQVVVAASHYDAMNGLAVEDTELGLKGRKNGSGKMLCDREMLTGTHVHKWVCRYKDEMDQERADTQNEMMAPRYSFTKQTGALPTLTAGQGGGARQK